METVQTVQQHSRSLKKHYALSALLCTFGFALFFYAFSRSPEELSFMAYVSAGIGLAGLAWMGVIRVSMWWRHG